MRIAAHGLDADLPERWEGRLYVRSTAQRAFAHGAAYGHPQERPNPVLHVANFALPGGRGDYGTGAVETMGRQHVFVALVEFDAEEAGRPLFAARGFPGLTVRDFAPNQLQRRIAGQLGAQRFFTEQGRPFCQYVVLGSQQHAVELVREVHDVVGRIEVSPR
jgi:hypothetical protein